MVCLPPTWNVVEKNGECQRQFKYPVYGLVLLPVFMMREKKVLLLQSLYQLQTLIVHQSTKIFYGVPHETNKFYTFPSYIVIISRPSRNYVVCTYETKICFFLYKECFADAKTTHDVTRSSCHHAPYMEVLPDSWKLSLTLCSDNCSPSAHATEMT